MSSLVVAAPVGSYITKVVRFRLRTDTDAGRLLLALLALALVLRFGFACEAMAAAPASPAAHQVHCPDIPAKPDKPTKADMSTCTLCVSLPHSFDARLPTISVAQVSPTFSVPVRLAGLARGPSPPPPRIA